MKIKGLLKWVDSIPSILQRITSTGNYLPEIDGLRFFAIFWMVLFHLNAYIVAKAFPGTLENLFKQSFIFQLLSVGNRGVELLFVLTGFMFFFMIKKDQDGNLFVNLKKYYSRRITRLIPPLVISLFVWFILEITLFASENKPAAELFLSMIASIFQAHYIFYLRPSYINGPLWAFEIIMQFYLIAPLLVCLFRIKNNWFRWGLMAFLMILGTMIKQLVGPFLPPYAMEGTIVRYTQWFICGILLADLCSVFPVKTKKWWFDPIGVITWISIVLAAHVSSYELRSGLLLMAILPAFYCVFRGTFLNQLFTNRWIVSLGGICFTIYLYHYLPISSIGRFLNPLVTIQDYNLRVVVFILVIMPAVIISGIILFFLFEKPFMDPQWPRKLTCFLQKIFNKNVQRYTQDKI